MCANEKCVEFEGFKDLIRLTKQDQWFCSKKNKITHRKSRLQNTRSSFVTVNVFFFNWSTFSNNSTSVMSQIINVIFMCLLQCNVFPNKLTYHVLWRHCGLASFFMDVSGFAEKTRLSPLPLYFSRPPVERQTADKRPTAGI